MTKYHINYTKNMKGGLLATTNKDITYIGEDNILTLSSSLTSNLDQIKTLNIDKVIACGSSACIYSNNSDAIIRLSGPKEFYGYTILNFLNKELSTEPNQYGYFNIIKLLDFGEYKYYKYNKEQSKYEISYNVPRPLNCEESTIENCITMYSQGLYSILENCEGGDLLNNIHSYNELGDIKILVYNILHGALFIHGKGFIHCDLKLDNIVLKYKSTLDDIRIIDFGSAINIKDGIQNNSTFNEYYTPPEIVRMGHSKKSDIYSIGAILTLIICKKEINMIDGYINLEDEGPLKDSGFYSEDLHDFLRNLLNPNIKERFDANQALDHIWLKDTISYRSLSPTVKDRIITSSPTIDPNPKVNKPETFVPILALPKILPKTISKPVPKEITIPKEIPKQEEKKRDLANFLGKL